MWLVKFGLLFIWLEAFYPCIGWKQVLFVVKQQSGAVSSLVLKFGLSRLASRHTLRPSMHLESFFIVNIFIIISELQFKTDLGRYCNGNFVWRIKTFPSYHEQVISHSTAGVAANHKLIYLIRL